MISDSDSMISDSFTFIDPWFEALWLLQILGIDFREEDGRVLLRDSPEFDIKDAEFIFNNLPTPMAETRIGELRAFLDTLVPIHQTLTYLGHIGHSIENILSRCQYKVDRAASAQGLASLPDDTLSKIFHEASLAKNTRKWKFSLTVSQVCGRFRQVALKTPSLWSYIALTMPTDMLVTFMERSDDARLHLCLSDAGIASGRSSQPGRNIVQDFWTIIHGNVHRIVWLDVELNALGHTASSRLLDMISVFQCPRLEEFRICYGNCSGEPGEVTSVSADQFIEGDIFLPSLRSTTIVSRGRFPLSLSQGITTLVIELLEDFNSASFGALLSLLSASNSLEHLTVVCHERGFAPAPEGVMASVEAPSVTTFVLVADELSNFNDWTFRDFIRACCFPNMAHLSVKVTEHYVPQTPRPQESPPSRCASYTSQPGPLDDWNSDDGDGDDGEEDHFDCTPFLEDIFEGRNVYPALLSLNLEISMAQDVPNRCLPYFTIPFEAYAPNLQHFAIAAGKLSSLWRTMLPPLRTLRVEGCAYLDVSWISQYVEGLVECGMLDQFERLYVSGDEAVMNSLSPELLEEQPYLKYLGGRIDVRVVEYYSPFTSPGLDFTKDIVSVRDMDEFMGQGATSL